MANPVCTKCQRSCQQLDFVVVIRCPLFEPVMGEEKLLDELTHVEQEVAQLRKRTSLFLTKLSQGRREGEGDE